VWLAVGKVDLGLLALVLAAVLLGNVIAAVHHAEVVALRVGESYGTLLLALAVTVIEVGLIISIMRSGDRNPTLLRDSYTPSCMGSLGCASSSAPSVNANPSSVWREPRRFSPF
jgi:Ca2+/H+ antiporter